MNNNLPTKWFHVFLIIDFEFFFLHLYTDQCFDEKKLQQMNFPILMTQLILIGKKKSWRLVTNFGSGFREIMWWVANKSKLLSFQEVFLKRRLSNFVAQVSQIWRRTIRKYDFTYLSTVKSAICLKVSLLSGQVEHMWTVGFCPRFLLSDVLTLF